MTQTAGPFSEAPSGASLLRATLIAGVAAAAVLVAFVLPAEYGLDPTGAGRVLGLTQLGEMKKTQQEGASAEAAKDDVIEKTADGGTRATIVIRPYSGREVKGWLRQGEEMPYEWSAGGVEMTFDLHGEPKDGGAEKAVSFEMGKAASAKGVFKAPFEGLHGWFWKNLTAKPVTLVVTVSGPVRKFAPLTAAGNGGTASAAPASADGTAYDTSLTMQTVMAEVFQHNAQRLWDKTGYISDQTGNHSNFPKDDAEWQVAVNDATTVAEATNVLMLPGRRVAEREWDKAVVETRKQALAVAAAAKKKDNDTFMNTTLELYNACESCHEKYRPTS